MKLWKNIKESKEALDDNLFQTSYEYEEEIREQGIERGIEQTIKNTILRFKELNYSIDTIKEIYPNMEIKKIKEILGL